jgi:ribosomal-protein-alanine N-acetyltransferase
VSDLWPVTLRDGVIGLRPLRRRDGREWSAVRARNADWLRPWDATLPDPTRQRLPNFSAMVTHLRQEARMLRVLPWVITYEGRLVGQVTMGGITWGSQCGAHIGYWVDEAVAGRGVTPTAVALACDHAFTTMKLHRIEINIRPENTASRRVAEKLGLRLEGMREKYLHIDGEWRDHLSFAVLRDEVPDGLLARWHRTRALMA